VNKRTAVSGFETLRLRQEFSTPNHTLSWALWILTLTIFSTDSIIVGLLGESLQFGRGLIRHKASLVAENLFLRKELAFYPITHLKPVLRADRP
jgi:hypothetical protein